MSRTGLCDVCGDAPGQFTCESCGALVCRAHYDRETGRCIDCARESGPEV